MGTQIVVAHAAGARRRGASLDGVGVPGLNQDPIREEVSFRPLNASHDASPNLKALHMQSRGRLSRFRMADDGLSLLLGLRL